MNSRKSSNTDYRLVSIITGIFFIVATVSAIIGAKLYDPILLDPDYLKAGYCNSSRIVGGAIGELFTSCANIGTAIMLYPILRKFNESIGIGYVCFRFLEVVFIVIGIVSILSLLTLSGAYANGSIELSQATVAGNVLKAAYKWCFLLGPQFALGINTSLYSYVLYKTGLVPKGIAGLGIIGAVLIFLVAILQMFGVVAQLSPAHIILTIPVAVYEMVLAGRLIVKGYNQKALAALGFVS